MSALGDYVHLKAKNYKKFGITKKEPTPSFINWQGEHQALQAKIKNEQRNDAQNKKVMQTMQLIQDQMWAIQDTAEQDETQQIQQIIKDLFFTKNNFEQYQDVIRNFNFGAGSFELNPAGGKLRSGLSEQAMQRISQVGKTFTQRLSKSNTSTFLEYRDEFNINTLRSIISDVQKALNSVSDLDKNFRTKIEVALTNAKAAQQKLAKINNTIRTGAEWMKHSTKGKATGLTLKNLNQKYVLKSEYTEVMEAFQKLILLISIPATQIASMEGFFLEAIIEALSTQGNKLGVKEVTDHLEKVGQNGQSQTEARFQFDLNPAVAKELANLVVTTKTKKGDSTSTYYSDFVKEGRFQYKSSSFQKADVNLEMDFEDNSSARKNEMIGLSLKSSSLKSDIHIVTGSPLMVFILGWLKEVDKINHLLNIMATHEDDAQVNLISPRKAIRDALALSIIYSGLTGKNVGKESGFAEYLVIVQRANNRDNMIVINMNDFISNLNQEALNSFITLSDGQIIDSLLFSQHSVDANEGPSQISAEKRIASLIARLHQIKVSAAIKRNYITANYKVNNQV